MVTTVRSGLRSVRLVVALVVVVALGLGAAAGARAAVFWTSQGTGTIGRANPDGSSPNQSLITGLGSPNGIAVAGGFIYWANASTNSIGRANADGTGVNATFITGASSPVGVAVDGQFVYWANQGSNSIGRATLAGAGANQSFITGTNNTYAVAVDAQHVYWTNANDGAIGRASIDGASPVQSFITGASNPVGVAVDGQHVYWSNNNSGFIGRADLDGTHPDQQYVATQGHPFGVAVDSQGIYWDDRPGGRIGKATLDAATVTPAFIAGASTPVGVAIGAAQSPQAGPPSVSITSPADGSSYLSGTAVDASYRCTAGASGGVLKSGAAGCASPVPAGQPIDTTTVGAHAFTVTAADTDGQTVAATVHYTVMGALAPAGPPSASIAAPADRATYTQGAAVTAAYSCKAGVPGGLLRPGSSGCAGTVAVGQPIDTTAVGAHAFTVTAADTDGQTAAATSSYTVVAAPALRPPPTLTASFAADPGMPCANQAVNLDASGSTAGGSPISSYDWTIDFGGGYGDHIVTSEPTAQTAFPSTLISDQYLGLQTHTPTKTHVPTLYMVYDLTYARPPAKITLDVFDTTRAGATTSRTITFADPVVVWRVGFSVNWDASEWFISDGTPYRCSNSARNPFTTTINTTSVATAAAFTASAPVYSARAGAVRLALACQNPISSCIALVDLVPPSLGRAVEARRRVAAPPSSLGRAFLLLAAGRKSTVTVRLSRQGRTFVRVHRLRRVTVRLGSPRASGRIVASSRTVKLHVSR